MNTAPFSPGDIVVHAFSPAGKTFKVAKCNAVILWKGSQDNHIDVDWWEVVFTDGTGTRHDACRRATKLEQVLE